MQPALQKHRPCSVKRLGVRRKTHTWNAGPECIVKRVIDTDLPEHLQLLLIPNLKDPAHERVLPGVQLDTTNVTEELGHETRALVAVLHLLLLQLLEDTGNERVQRDRHDHDPNTDERRPAHDVVERHKRQGDLQLTKKY